MHGHAVMELTSAGSSTGNKPSDHYSPNDNICENEGTSQLQDRLDSRKAIDSNAKVNLQCTKRRLQDQENSGQNSKRSQIIAQQGPSDDPIKSTYLPQNPSTKNDHTDYVYNFQEFDYNFER
ncbi:uncharacterized protein TRIADDRAFT_62764 [Trichoplax adhaerens]|uniref:Uncharacterized protein n=1 Tax=Trichoplax adhaerens TaxID=10228 RepID=B3SET1_TRIAD|nr:predicted protein [Trichoplax adhaerens]EDV18764.1 predicted protein [Trichoplax adhaerens]|eukprot:XP_002118750.1 predicted protein [Trichoplax adhaerens]